MTETVKSEAPLNICQRLNAIKKAIPYIQKDKEVSGAGTYMAVTHDAVTAATRSLFVEHGVLILTSELTSSVVDSGMVTGKGNPIIRFEAKYEVQFVNVDTPTESVTINLTAHALDQGDKAPGKALSYATKSAVLKVLQIETGVDDEGREATKPAKHAGIPLPEQSGSATAGAGEGIAPERQKELYALFNRLVDFMDAKDIPGAYEAYSKVTDADERVYVWHLLKPHSKFRKELGKYGEDKAKEATSGVRA